MVSQNPSTTPAPVSLLYGAGLSAGTGLLYFLSFPGIDVWPLAFVAFVPLLIALRHQTPRRGLFFGWIAGFVMTMTGFYWLLEMLRTFSGFSTLPCLFFMSVLCAYQGGRIALFGWLQARMTTRGLGLGVAAPLAFTASELLFPLLFPWYFGASMHAVLPLLQIVELTGPIGLGLVVLAANLGLAELVFARLDRRPIQRRALVVPAVVLAGTACFGVIRIRMVDEAVVKAPKAEVGLVQANMSLFGKRREKAEGLRRHLALTEKLREQGPLDLVVWSETSVMSAVLESEAKERIPEVVGKRIGVNAIFGAVLARPVDDVREMVFFNSAVATNPSGALVGRYDKQYLLAFGEYLPFGETFPILYEWSPNSGRFSEGKSLAALHVAGHPISTIICYEDLLPHFVNSMFRHEPGHLLVNMTNDAWFGDSIEPAIHMTLSKLRAVEQRRFFVRSTNSGVSGIVDPVGRMLGSTKTFEQAVLRRRIAWLDGSTVYRVLGDIPVGLGALAALLAAFIRPSGRLGRWLSLFPRPKPREGSLAQPPE